MEGADLSKMTAAQKEALMTQVKQQMMLLNTQELLSNVIDQCFTRCIPKPGSSLDNSEQKCLAMCMDRFMDSWNLVSRTYGARLSLEKSKY
ncbi:mitochondrial import inner membrane translocase subunit Tim13 [Hyalella azteca]|uniref:Mitochondrial import inner membrane translocase subunit n=1 Tax=Hyalella azteca TaxID=294128 RepID=A0A8B7MZ78_HYAAZ|nr:mitochondrial import inner membrane translocase subunit Tim13 [Hyalella azteca]